MKNINQISDTEIDEIINGCIEGVYPTSHEVSMALEIKSSRAYQAASMPVDLHPDTKKLVADFSTVLAEKLYKAQLKYGHSDNWSFANWEIECQTAFHEHIAKGDPRDVAAYCAFMWFHGWKTEPSKAIPAALPGEVDASDDMFRKLNARESVIAARWWNACRDAMLKSEPEGRDYRAIVERIAEIMHGSVTDIDLLVVTVLSMKQQSVSAHEKSSA